MAHQKGGSGTTYTQFVFRPSGDNLAVYESAGPNPGLVKGTIALPGGGTAVYNANGFNYFRHKDWLGSSVLATTWQHAVYSKEAYAPFGETYNEWGSSPDRSFTGQDQDVATGSGGGGVYDFLFRKYDPSAGRWLSPDPSGWSATEIDDPQSLDRYAYVENRPMNSIDPSGLILCSIVSSDGSIGWYDSGSDSCNGDWTAVLHQAIVVYDDGCHGAIDPNSTDCMQVDHYSNWMKLEAPSYDPGYQLAIGLSEDGAYSLTSVCAPIAFYGASGTIAFSGVAAGGGYAGAESAEVITSTMKIPAVTWTSLGLSTVGAWFHKEIASVTNSVCSIH